MISDITPTDYGSASRRNPVGTPLADPRYERFAQAVAAGLSYKSAYEAAFPNPTHSARHHASRLAADSSVKARVSQLTAAAAEGAMPAIRERIAALLTLSQADPSELFRLDIECCNDCWSDDALATAWDAAAATNSPMPDPSQPRPSCERCGGRGVRHVVLTPPDELSASGRQLLKAVRQKSDGSIEYVVHDQLAATRLLAELSGWLVNQNLNLNANVPSGAAPAAVSATDVLSKWRAFRSETPQS